MMVSVLRMEGEKETGAKKGGRDGRRQVFLLQKADISTLSSRISQNFLLFLHLFHVINRLLFRNQKLSEKIQKNVSVLINIFS